MATRTRTKLLSAAVALVVALGVCVPPALADPGGAGLRAGSVPSAQGGTIAEGTWGTCPWEISADGVLTIGAGEGVEDLSWSDYSDRITSVITTGRVVLPEDSSYMFSWMENLISADLSGFDTSNVTNMHQMFSDCTSLKSLNLSGWDTSKVTDMESMFWHCDSLESLDISSFDTSNVQDMLCMFAYCSSLKSIDLSRFSTASATKMSRMFEGCDSLVELDLSTFDTSKSTYMGGTFSFAYGLQKVTVGSGFSFKCDENDPGAILSGISWHSEKADAWFTPEEIASTRSNIADTYTRPAGQDIARGTWGTCSWVIDSDFVLTIGPGTGTDTELITFYTGSAPWGHQSELTAIKTTGRIILPAKSTALFAGCSKIKTLDLSNFDTSNVVDMSGMFMSCKSLESINLSGFDTSMVENMSKMFFFVPSSNDVLKTLDLSSFDTSNVTDMSYMFGGCDALETIYVGDKWSMQNVTNSSNMFYCPSLVGGNGTAYNANHTDGEYARIDEEGAPGYFTSKQVPVKQSIADAVVTGVKAKTYTGKAMIQNPTVKYGAITLVKGIDYTLSYKNNVKAGIATMVVTGKGDYIGAKSVTFKINTAKQPMTVKAAKRTVKFATLKKKAVSLTKTITVKKNQGKVTYKNVSTQKAAKKFKVNAKKGTIVIPKGTKKAVYLVKVKVTAKGNANYKAGSKTVTVKVRVK